jgi:hypothetical protein
VALRSWLWWKWKLGDDAQEPIKVEGADIVIVPEGPAVPPIVTEDFGIKPLPLGGQKLEGL